ncbi:MAG: glucose-6-phosphate dehydrogenase [Candidatus Eremiobacteraeota bacterium]|nr:glucose-6-phosphate dehydrogenase [Candidatus Eremiobacteraeota bacterium]MBV8365155.1 glucose-6-phosphate dehydrogenase [Candidatus Eremiobacteraeota bacterium]
MAATQLVNPFREGLREDRATTPVQIVIFGASGDLTNRKLLPALYNLAQADLLPENFCVVGFARSEMTDDQFRDALRKSVAESGEVRVRDERVLDELAKRCYYVSGMFDDKSAFARLAKVLAENDQRYNTAGNRIFYISTPASLFGIIVEQLHDAGLTGAPDTPGSVRIIVEKPFGRDLASAKALNTEMLAYLREDQIYRIDHYLGKETVQNILVLRFANGIFEPIWDRNYVDSVQITVAESLGLEGRGSFYEETGVIRDIVQNHGMQLLSLVGMEPPTTFDARDFRDEKVRVIEAIRPIDLKEAVRGQYGPGYVNGQPVPGYREEPNVSPSSMVPTFSALRLFVDNWRWAGVPFYLRAGKRMPKRVTEIAIQFKEAPHLPFRKSQIEQAEGNVLALRIQPDEGVTLKLEAKVPGPSMRIRSVAMDFSYGATFGTEDASPYERLILDCMKGDQTLFDRADGVEAAWSLVDPLLQAWDADKSMTFPNYAAGTWGPKQAEELIRRDGRAWRLP